MKKLTSFLNKNLRVLALVLIGAVVGGATTGVVMAAIPDSGGLIHGCRNNLTRAVTAIDSDAGQSCGLGTTALNWTKDDRAFFISQTITITSGADTIINSGPYDLNCPTGSIMLPETQLIQILSGDNLFGTPNIYAQPYTYGNYTQFHLAIAGIQSQESTASGSETAKMAVACQPAVNIPQ